MSKIEDIASVHLGKAGDGTVVKPYVTSNEIQAELLVAIPRSLNREQYGITDKDFVGVDVWNCYEVSFIDKSMNAPYTQIAKIVYPSDSEFIVESKSLKLYLNSFNMSKLEIYDAVDRIRTDLKALLNTDVTVSFHFDKPTKIGYLPSIGLTTRVKPNTVDFKSFTVLTKTPLDETDIPPPYLHLFHFDHLRSNCRVTNQPDWGDIYIKMHGDHGAISDEVHDYISSLRTENHFHEEICEAVFHKLKQTFKPRNLVVACFYTRRGGIDINPIRASSYKDLEDFDTGKYRFSHNLSEKTLKQ